jgi:hypothetical protein
MRATYHRTEGVRHLLAAYELGEDKLFGHVKLRKTRTRHRTSHLPSGCPGLVQGPE